jgi:hypothetical protein
MRRFLFLCVPLVLVFACVVAAQGQKPPVPRPYGTLAQLMRAIPFGHSNLIFDTQTQDPAAPRKAETGDGASAKFANIYTGWPMVEASALALAETANLMLIPGRLCDNGRPVPLERDDFKKFVQGLADAGLAARKAAQSRNQDAMVEVSGGKPRCTP